MIHKEIIKWARNKANLDQESASNKLDVSLEKYQSWENGNEKPNLSEVEKISDKFYVPLSILFLNKPPKLKLPINDFRDSKVGQEPSLDLLTTIEEAQERQNWLSSFLENENRDSNSIYSEDFANKNDNHIANAIRNFININKARKESNYKNFANICSKQLWNKNFLVILKGIVKKNTHRKLDAEEFKGFAINDRYVPLIFINGADPYPRSKTFTLFHELAHIFLGDTGLDGSNILAKQKLETRCNQIAGKALISDDEVKGLWNTKTIDEISLSFKVSVFVVLSRAKDNNLIGLSEFNDLWSHYESQIKPPVNKSNGGNSYNTIPYYSGGDFFYKTLYEATITEKVLYRDAYSLIGLKAKTFNKFFKRQGYA